MSLIFKQKDGSIIKLGRKEFKCHRTDNGSFLREFNGKKLTFKFTDKFPTIKDFYEFLVYHRIKYDKLTSIEIDNSNDGREITLYIKTQGNNIILNSENAYMSIIPPLVDLEIIEVSFMNSLSEFCGSDDGAKTVLEPFKSKNNNDYVIYFFIVMICFLIFFSKTLNS